MPTSPDFSELGPFIEKWGLETPHERLEHRSTATMSELTAFHEAIVPRLREIIEFLNQYPVDEIPEQHLPLAYAALAVCEVDDAVHMWKAPNLDMYSDPVGWRTKTSYYDYK